MFSYVGFEMLISLSAEGNIIILDVDIHYVIILDIGSIVHRYFFYAIQVLFFIWILLS